ncbi:hypothetical protein Ciccas_000102 [Cichlidogyrus casuarinus]|uniref:BTB domain-containing protein n=1 Tax=Cichlidogyrus casuarinus TaxID=1844966 RepID=A0ABD2QNX5_9PLAT
MSSLSITSSEHETETDYASEFSRTKEYIDNKAREDDDLMAVLQHDNSQSEKKATSLILGDDDLRKLLDTEIICQNSLEPVKAPFFVLAKSSEYFRLAFQYTHSKTEKPYKIEIPEINRSTMQSIINYLLDLEELDDDPYLLSELMAASNFLLIPKLDLALTVKIKDLIPSLNTDNDEKFFASVIQFYHNSEIPKKFLKNTLLTYFSKHSTSFKLIGSLGEKFVASLFESGCPFFLPYDSTEDDIRIPIYDYYKNAERKFLDSLPFKPTLNNNDLQVYNGVPDALCITIHATFGHHNEAFANFRLITEKLTTCTVSPKEYRLSAIIAYLNRGWNTNDDVDFIEGLEAEYENLETGKIVVISPWNGFGNHGQIRRIEIPKTERITSIQINHGWLIDHIGFTTSLGRNLGQVGSSDGGNVSFFDVRTHNFKFINDGINPRRELLQISPVALFGFKYDVISSSEMPFINNLKFVFTAFNKTIQDKLVEYHSAALRVKAKYLETPL